jgi:hypothetical protein
MPVKLRAFLDFAVPRFKALLGNMPKQLASRERRDRTSFK